MQKMKRSALRLTLSLCVLSAFGFAARWVQNISIFEKGTGLAAKGAASSTFLVLYSLAAVGGLCLLLLPFLRLDVSDTPAGDVRGDGRMFKWISMASALLLLAAGILLFLQRTAGSSVQLTRVLGILAIASAGGIAYTGSAGKAGADSAGACLASITPVLFGCFWLIVSYKEHAANPVIWAYAVEIIAIACLTMALYLIAGFVFGRARIISTACVTAAAAFFCFMALGDDRGLAYQLCFAALGIFFVATLYALVSGLHPERRRFQHLKDK